MVNNGFGDERIKRFAQCGSCGAQPQNVERDMAAWLDSHGLDIKPYQIELDAVDFDGTTRKLKFDIVAPHDYLRAAYMCGEIAWQASMLGEHTREDCLHFWENMLQQPFGCTHPIVRHTEHMEMTIPLVFHVDGAESFRQVEAVIWSMSSIMSGSNV